MSKKINNEKNTFDNMNFDQKFIRELRVGLPFLNNFIQ